MHKFDEDVGSYLGKKLRGGWSQSVSLQAGGNQQATGLSMNLPDADTYTVQFSMDQRPSYVIGPSVKIASCQAIIEWCIEGVTLFRIVDVADGQSVSGRGQSVKVILFDTSPKTTGGPTYQVSTLVSKGVRGDTLKPPTLIALNRAGLPPTANVQVSVPVNPSAGVISVEVVVEREAAADPAPQVDVQQLLPFPAPGVVKAYDPDINIGFVAMHPQAAQVNVINNGTATVAVTITWGIDG